MENHEDFGYFFVPSDTGEFKTIGGNYTVVVDNVEMVQDEDEAYRYFRMKYDKRVRDRATFNAGIDSPAKPAQGFDEYLAKVNEAVQLSGDREGTVFIEIIIGENGEISQAEIVEGTYGQDWSQEVKNEVLQAVMGVDASWVPAEKNGEPTSSIIEIPVDLSKQ
jgi:hypothetical protein